MTGICSSQLEEWKGEGHIQGRGSLSVSKGNNRFTAVVWERGGKKLTLATTKTQKADFE